MENNSENKSLHKRGVENKMDEYALAELIYNQAKRDMFNGKGRIIISDFKKAIGQPNLTAEEIIKTFKKHYPNIPIEQRTQNVILINFG